MIDEPTQELAAGPACRLIPLLVLGTQNAKLEQRTEGCMGRERRRQIDG